MNMTTNDYGRERSYPRYADKAREKARQKQLVRQNEENKQVRCYIHALELHIARKRECWGWLNSSSR